MIIILLIGAFAFNSTAHLLLKIGAKTGLQLHSYNPIFIIRENYITLIGLFFFLASTVCYFVVLKTLPVSVAYPTVIISSFVIINFFAYFYLQENINSAQLFGYGFLIAGIFLIYYFKK